MMKKIGVTALVLVMVLACSLAMVSEPADSVVDRDVQMSIGTVSAEPGATSVDVELTIDKNIGFFGAQVQISYDSNLTLTNAKGTGIMSVTCSPDYASPYNLYIQSNQPENTTATGAVVTLTFSVSKSAPDEMPISFVNVTMFNYDEDEISPALTNGKIVTGEITVAVTGVAVTPSSYSLDVGKSAQLSYAIAPSNATNKNVTWSSDNTAVATVNDGKVTAISYGTAVITVTTEDGAKTSSCYVTVEKPTIPVTSVVLNKDNMTVYVGYSDVLTATVLPDNATTKDVKWSSSNSNRASVVDGVVTGVGVGSAVIIVTTVDGGHAAVCNVTVKAAPDQPISVTGISLDKTSMSIEVGKSSSLIATVTPDDATNKAVNWTSANSNIATVSANGVVTAKAEGVTTIQATTVDGNKTVSCTVTVTAASSTTVDVTGVSINKGSTTLAIGKSETLTATVTPDNATNKNVIWKSSDESVATVSSSGVVKAVSEGTAKITVTTQDGGYTDTCTVTVNESGSGSSGGDNTMLYLGIVVVIIIVLLLIFLMLKKSGKI